MLGGWFVAQLYVNYYAKMLQESNLTWAEIQVEKTIIKQQEPIFLFIGFIVIAIVIVISRVTAET